MKLTVLILCLLTVACGKSNSDQTNNSSQTFISGYSQRFTQPLNATDSVITICGLTIYSYQGELYSKAIIDTSNVIIFQAPMIDGFYEQPSIDNSFICYFQILNSELVSNPNLSSYVR